MYANIIAFKLLEYLSINFYTNKNLLHSIRLHVIYEKSIQTKAKS